jgi:cysteinyl-tRNA synthetase
MSITFREFVELVEGKKNKNEPPNAVPGTYNIDHETGNTSYTLKPANPNKTGSLAKSDILKSLKKQGGIGAKAVKKGIEQREKELKKLRKKDKVTEGKVILGKGETYGSEGYQDRLEKQRQKQKKEKEAQRQQNADAARREFRKDGVPFNDPEGKGRIRNGIKHYDT